MKAMLPRGYRREEYIDGVQWSEALYRGGLRPEDGYELGLVTGYYGSLLRMLYGEDKDDLDRYGSEEWLQQKQPDIFVRKLRSRRIYGRTPPPRRGERSNSTFITPDQFARQYAAVAFAFHHGLTCQTAVTLWWPELGADDAASATKLFSTFLKCLNDWLAERELPTVYFYCHEGSRRAGLHTHLALYLGQGLEFDRTLRDEFAQWRTTWVENHAPKARPARAARITGSVRGGERLHWQRFHYQMKGYDPHAVVRTALNSADRRDLLLGDLIGYHWQDPGVVGMTPRVGHSRNLGPERREAGIPEGCAELLSVERERAQAQKAAAKRTSPFAPPSAELGTSGKAKVQPDVFWEVGWSPQPTPPPFVSQYDDGHRSVWDLYPLDFNEWVVGQSYAFLKRPLEPWERDRSDPLWQPHELPPDFFADMLD